MVFRAHTYLCVFSFLFVMSAGAVAQETAEINVDVASPAPVAVEGASVKADKKLGSEKVPFNIGLVPYANINAYKYDPHNNFSLDILVGISGSVTGFTGAGLVSITSNVVGMQLGLATNVARDVHGVQLGLATNVARDVRGVQLGLAASVARDVSGFQLGFSNVARNVFGVQWGLVTSVARKVRGVQLGVVNVAGEVTERSVQIGLINLSDKVGNASVGLINIHKKGKHTL
ncbi:MAG: hypothetical protein GY762_09720, partial [Proteobacteria bacterium]|nr:hypothetical protein [Pseudomonadota bacterium]